MYAATEHVILGFGGLFSNQGRFVGPDSAASEHKIWFDVFDNMQITWGMMKHSEVCHEVFVT